MSDRSGRKALEALLHDTGMNLSLVLTLVERLEKEESVELTNAIKEKFIETMSALPVDTGMDIGPDQCHILGYPVKLEDWKRWCSVYGYLVHVHEGPLQEDVDLGHFIEAIQHCGIMDDYCLGFFREMDLTVFQCQWLLFVHQVHCKNSLLSKQSQLADAIFPVESIPVLKQQLMGWAIAQLDPDSNDLCFYDGTPFNVNILHYRAFRNFCFDKLHMRRNEDVCRIFMVYGTYDYVQLSYFLISLAFKSIHERDLMNIENRHLLEQAFVFMERRATFLGRGMDYRQCTHDKSPNPYLRMEHFNTQDYTIFEMNNKLEDPDELDQKASLMTATKTPIGGKRKRGS